MSECADPSREDLVVAHGEIHVGVNSRVTVWVGVEAAEAGEGDAELALGGCQHEFGVDDLVVPGGDGAVEGGRARLGEGEKADRVSGEAV